MNFELHYNYFRADNVAPESFTTWRAELPKLLAAARGFINAWRIVRDDGVVIACSYDGFTSKEHAERNGRVD